MAKDEKLKLNPANLFVEYSEDIDRAFKRAVRDALRKHKQANNSVAIWRGGKIVLLQPDEIPGTIK
jgi:hypothetical protein